MLEQFLVPIGLYLPVDYPASELRLSLAIIAEVKKRTLLFLDKPTRTRHGLMLDFLVESLQIH